MYLIFLLGGDHAGGKGVCRRLMSPAHETQSMREIRLLRGRLPRKGGGLTGPSIKDCLCLIKYVLRCLYIEDDNRFIFLTEIKNVGKPETDIDV